MIATVYGRFHYVLDTLAGAGLAIAVVVAYRYLSGGVPGESQSARDAAIGQGTHSLESIALARNHDKHRRPQTTAVKAPLPLHASAPTRVRRLSHNPAA